MKTIQGIISKTINNTEIQLEKLGYISSNVANINTNGYKCTRFEQILNENGYLNAVVRTDHSEGNFFKTGRPLDVAISGAGYIPVTTETGEIAYTRDGSFKIGKDGYLYSMRGDLIADGIQIPVNTSRIDITPEGKINIMIQANTQPKTVGTIPLVQFTNPEGLKDIGGNKYIATENSGEPVLDKKNTAFNQGVVEIANTNIYDEISEVMRVNTSTLASYQLIKAVDQMYQKGIQLTE